MHAKTNNLDQSVVASHSPATQLDMPVLVRWQLPSGQIEPSLHSDEWLVFDSLQQDFTAALKEACKQYPGHDLILLRNDIELPADLLKRICFWQVQLPDTDAITVLSNWHPAFNPFGLAGHLPEPPVDANLDALVANTSSKRLYRVSQWPEHLIWIKADVAQRLVQTDRVLSETLPERLGIRMLVADDIFARCSQSALATPAPAYDWDLPPAFPAEYRQHTLHQLVEDQVWHLHRIDPAQKPVMLHICHSWGGGVSRWVEDYCIHDNSHTHLILQSRGFWKKKQYGTQLSLHQVQPDGPKLNEWWLSPGIFSTEIRNQQYQEILNEIQRCYAISRVIVSSLIGHSLDALRCPLPTIQVIHDYYPAWPLLSIAPGADPEQIDLEHSLSEAKESELEFVDRDSRDWSVLTRSWLYHLRHPRVRMVAPTNAAHRQLLAICPDAERIEVKIIGHGLRPWDYSTAGEQLNDVDYQETQNRPIRALILGRLQQGKGRDLLLNALPRFSNDIQLTALGCGRQARELLGTNNVNVIMQYDWQALPALVKSINPDIALLLSTVPETFSYTLSELQALHIPVIATRNGSFVDRIEHGIDGLLIEPSSQALSDTLNGLVENRIILTQLKQQARRNQPDNMQQMLAGYQSVWDSIDVAPRPIPPMLSKTDAASAQLLNHQRLSEWRSRALQQTNDKLQLTYQQLSARLKHMRKQAMELEQSREEKARLHEALTSITRRMRQTSTLLRNKEQHLQQTLGHLQHLQDRLDSIVNSRSWKLTKPLRLLNRVSYNLKLHGAFNPIRWPQLFGKFIQRVYRNGLKNTLRNLQEIPETTPAAHYFDPEMPVSAVIWPATVDGIEQPHTHIVLLEQSLLPSLAALLNQLVAATMLHPAQLHILLDTTSSEISSYLEECQGLQLHTTPKSLFKTLHTAYDAGHIENILLAQGAISTGVNSINALLDSTQYQPEAMLIGGVAVDTKEAIAHPLESYSREPGHLQLSLLLLRKSGVDGLLESKFPMQPLAEALPAIANLALTYDGIIWQQHSARYQCLDRLPEPVELPVEKSTSKPTILIIDGWVPTPDKDSGSMRMANLMQLLVDIGWHVVFCPLNMRHEGRYTDDLQSIGVEAWYQPYLNNFNEFLGHHGQRFQTVILSRHQTAGELLKMVRHHCPDAQVIFDTVDLHYLREQREAELENSLQLKRIAEQTKRQELGIIADADLTLVVSKAEQALLAEVTPDNRVEILSNIHITHGRRKDFLDRKDIVFVGGFQHPPNVDAVRWLCNDIWQLIAAQLPDVKLHIIGSKMPDEIIEFANDQIITHGYVENLEFFHDNCRLSLAPLRYGAGVKGKINSAMSYGLPVVATTTAVEGMDLHHERQVLIGDQSESFAAAVVRLYTDQVLWHKLSDASLSNVDEHFSMAAAKRQLDKILQN